MSGLVIQDVYYNRMRENINLKKNKILQLNVYFFVDLSN